MPNDFLWFVNYQLQTRQEILTTHREANFYFTNYHIKLISMIRKILLSSFILFILTLSHTQAQMTVGVYKGTFYSQLGIGSNPENKFFAEGRLFAGDFLNPLFGIEGIGQYNFVRSSWYNLSGGLMLGYSEFDEGRVGLHSMLSIKPLENHRNLALVLEATPFYSDFDFTLRANIGIRYMLGRMRE